MPFSFPSSPALNQFSTQNGRLYQWTGTVWNLVDNFAFINALAVGGGGGGGHQGGGGGAGGFIEQNIVLNLNTAYTVTVGAGGSATANVDIRTTCGTASSIGGFVGVGGGGGGTRNTTTAASGTTNGRDGGSGGGAAGSTATNYSAMAGSGVGQGFNGGLAITNFAGGGGGASAAGGTGGVSSAGGVGGNGSTSTITGLTYAGGGGGYVNGANPGTGGDGGGGRGGGNAPAVAGTANTGGGGGGGIPGANGGSGVVVISFSAALTCTVGAGLTYTSSTTGSTTTVIFTAGTDTITFS